METEDEVLDHLQALNQSITCGETIFGNELIDKVTKTLDEIIVTNNAKRTHSQLFNELAVIEHIMSPIKFSQSQLNVKSTYLDAIRRSGQIMCSTNDENPIQRPFVVLQSKKTEFDDTQNFTKFGCKDCLSSMNGEIYIKYGNFFKENYRSYDCQNSTCIGSCVSVAVVSKPKDSSLIISQILW